MVFLGKDEAEQVFSNYKLSKGLSFIEDESCFGKHGSAQASLRQYKKSMNFEFFIEQCNFGNYQLTQLLLERYPDYKMDRNIVTALFCLQQILIVQMTLLGLKMMKI